MNKIFKIALIAALVLGVLGAFIGYRMWNAPPETVEDMSALKVTPALLLQEFEQNEAAASKKYQQAAVEITGKVREVSANQDGFPLLILTAGDGSTEIICTMREKSVQVTAGSTQTIKGFFTDYDSMFGIKIIDCIIVK